MPESVTFYAWCEGGPADEIVRISGGQRAQDARGSIIATGMKEARFVQGIFHTSDPETIEVLRDMIKRGAAYTEDREVYLQHALSPEKLAARNAQKLSRVTEENNLLKQQLEEERRKNKGKAAA